MHGVHFPNESVKYRAKRNELLRAEMDLRTHVERVASLRRKLPLGGEVRDDYVFEGADGPVKLSELFRKHDTLVLYNFMYGPRMKDACPMCTAMLDSLDGAAEHLGQRVGVAVVAKSPIERIQDFARGRGWDHLRLISSADNSFNRDYQGETANGDQMPMLHVFTRRNGTVHHFWGSEMLFPSAMRGQNSRHIDMIWPLWNVLDLVPAGRGSDWIPRLSY
ncbi:MAG: DUF899 family protein [Xanthobacteraceae bacterium]|nr:DUF899 family protein [Xanthobacteraceae bacterium]